MGRTIEVKMAKASPDDLKRVREFFQVIEEVIEWGTFFNQYTEHSMEVSDEELVEKIREMWNERGPGVGSSWRRVVTGCEVLINNCCDPDSDVLEWKPELKKLMEPE